MTSIALSGKKRSVMYLVERRTAAGSASSSYVTPWCASYVSFRPLRISSEAAGDGSPILTG
jgi:hypothetical protein